MSAKVCFPSKQFCKRGHPRNEVNTFARKVTVKGKDYIVRECRQCHAIRNTPPSKTGRKNRSRWLARGQQS
jgi:cytochrome c2